MLVRDITEEDCEGLLMLNQQIDQETRYMMYEPGERKTTAVQQLEMIRSFMNMNNSNIFVAEEEGILRGHLTVIGGNPRRIQHRAHLVIGILDGFTGKGIGRLLFEKMEAWRMNTPLTRLELTVMAHNERAISLYTKLGFQMEGTKKQSIFVDNAYVDEYSMAKILE
ncbi:RimJ/RimL family protein N-acetyltransferase [Paenibacillus sp. DS2015]|uniref:GNAT family N-acetyltransferase n=1 Tax=Paenibacillus sp. DS2015 TaxID=3373917 RepID=UPI003D19D361